jgi:aromatic-amino-acid transaminase
VVTVFVVTVFVVPVLVAATDGAVLASRAPSAQPVEAARMHATLVGTSQREMDGVMLQSYGMLRRSGVRSRARPEAARCMQFSRSLSPSSAPLRYLEGPSRRCDGLHDPRKTPVTPPATKTFTTSLIPSAAGRPADDPIFLLNAEAQRRAQAGESILNATLGALMEDDGTLAVMPSVVEAIQRVPPKKAASYAPILGDAPFLRAVIHDLYEGHALAAKSIAAATPGGTGALYHAVTSFLEPGDALYTTSFYWSPYHTIAEHAGRKVETFPMFAPGGRLDLAAFESGLEALIRRQGRALIVFNFPCHNPTGYSLDEAEWAGVAEIVRRAGESAPVAFLVDLAYARFGSRSSQAWLPHAQRMLETCTVLVAWTASKTFAQYGARVGALVAAHSDAGERQRIQNALAYACRGTWSNCNHAGLLAITELLENAELKSKADRERARLIHLLDDRVAVFNREAAAARLKHPRYEGGFFVSVFTPDAERTAAAMREKGVYVVPLKGAVRVALCSTPVRDVPRLVEAIADGVHRSG